jgi:hypothetical protein
MALSRHIVWRIVVVGACVGLGAFGAVAQEQEQPQPQNIDIPADAKVLEGIPTVRIDSREGKTTRRVLGKEEASKNPLTVNIVNGQFFWASRENRRLQLSSTGEFTYLSSEPGKYIRIRRLNDRISYVEHVDMPFGQVTWWGELRIVSGKQ